MKSSMRENVKKFDMKKYTASWTKMRDLRHNLTHYLLQQNRFDTREDKTIEIEEVVRRFFVGMPLLTNLCLDTRTDLLAVIRCFSEFLTVIYGPAMTSAPPDAKVEA